MILPSDVYKRQVRRGRLHIPGRSRRRCQNHWDSCDRNRPPKYFSFFAGLRRKPRLPSPHYHHHPFLPHRTRHRECSSAHSRALEQWRICSGRGFPECRSSSRGPQDVYKRQVFCLAEEGRQLLNGKRLHFLVLRLRQRAAVCRIAGDQPLLVCQLQGRGNDLMEDRKSTRLNSSH